MSRIYFLSVLLCIFFCAAVVRAQDMHLPSRYFNTSNGLPQNTIRDIVQDDEGWLWIGTDNGLCIYDGYNFRMVDQMKGGEKLERGPTRFLKEKNTIWLFQKKLIARYNTSSKTIDTFHVPVKSSSGINPAYADSVKVIFLSYLNAFSFNKKTGVIVPVSFKKIDSKIQSVNLDYNSLFLNGNYVIHTDVNQKTSFVSKIDLDKLTSSVTVNTGIYAYSLSRIDSSFIYLGTDGKILFSETLTGKPRHVATVSSFPNKYEQIIQLKLGEHQFLIGTGRDIFHVQLSPSFRIRRVTQTDGSPLIQKGKLLCFYKDHIGNVWIGTNAEGLVQVPVPGNTFTLYRSARPEKNFIRTIHVDTFTQNVWAGLYFDNITVFDKYGLEQTELTIQLQNMLGKRSVVNYIHQLNRDEFLVFAELEKTYRINIANNTVTLCENVLTDSARYKKNHINIGSLSFITHIGGNRFMQLFDRLLTVFSYADNKIFIHRVISLPYGCTGMYKINNNDIWIGGQGKALNIDSTGRVKNSLSIVPDRQINAIVKDKLGAFWLGTDAGLYVYKDNRFTKLLSRRDGLADDYFYTLINDTSGYIWGSTNKGLTQVDIRSFRFRNFSEKDGLQGNEFNTGAAYQAKDGRIFFGGITGLNSFYPFTAKINSLQQHVRFTGIASVDSTLYNPIDQLPQEMVLPDKYGNLAVSFSAFNFFIPGVNEYEYRLDDGKEWLPTSGSNTLQLFLTPGGYTLQVRLKDQPATTASMRLNIDPPFYSSWWFISLCAIIGLSVTALIIRLYIRGKYQKQINALALREKVQQEKERISRELHDDLGVKANLLSYNASLLIDETASDDKELIGGRIKDAADDMLLALRETMWTLKQEKINTSEVWVRFKNFISKMQRTYHHISFVTENDNVAEKVLDYNDALNLVRILQEAVNNAIRHSGSPVIYYSAVIDTNDTLFTIRDSGKSFAEELIEPGDGLSNMRYRAKQSGFLLDIQAVPGTLTRVTVRV